ncbi:MAG: hypothetical protein OHK0017_03930 [Patescibacteria group bacterium]
MPFRKTFTKLFTLGVAVLLSAGFVLGVRAANVNSDVYLTINPTNFVNICPNPTFNDSNTNGQRDVGEPLINGLETVLSSTQRGVIETIQTDGSKCFKGIEEGTYTVTQTPPGATYLSTTGGTSKTVVATGSQKNVEFGYSAQTLICADPTFEDVNGNGNQDPGETPISNVSTKLVDSNGNTIATLVTGTDNCFRVDSTKCTAQNPCKISQQICSQSVSSCNYLPTCPIEYSNVVTQTGNRVNYKFCYKQTITLLCANPTFNDLNKNGIKDAEDIDLIGVRTELVNNSGQVVDFLITGTNGNNCFQLLSGDCSSLNPCTIRQPQCPGSQTQNCAWEPKCPTEYNNLTVTPGDRLDKKFCYTTKTRLICADPTFLDLNRNRVKDGNETSISGIRTILKDSDNNIIADQLSNTNNCFQIPEGKCTDLEKCSLYQETPSDKVAFCQNSYKDLSVEPGQTKSYVFCYVGKSNETIIIQMFSSVPQGPVLVNQRFDYQATLRNASGVKLTNVIVKIPVDPKVEINQSSLRFGRINGRAYASNKILDSLGIQALAQSTERNINYNANTREIEVKVPSMDPSEEVDVTYTVVVKKPETNVNLNILGRATTYSDQFGTSQSPLLSNTLIHLVILSTIIPRTGGDMYQIFFSNLIWILPVLMVVIIGIILILNRKRWMKEIDLKD